MKKNTVVGGVILGLLGTLPVQAQESTDQTIVVQATRVEKDIKDVPQSIDVVTSDDIETNRYQTVADAIKSIPNMVLTATPGDYHYIQVRGLPRNLEQNNVPIYVDGVPQTSLYGLNLRLSDVESIEFLRGPQGNIYGSNARDGIIVITTKKPSDEPSASVKFGLANYNEKSAQLIASSGVGNNDISAKVAIDHLKREGFVDNTYLGKTIDEKTQNNIAFSLNWTPETDWSASLYLDYGRIDGGAYPYVPDNPETDRGDDLKAAMEVENIFDQKSKGAALRIGWNMSPQWALNSVTGYRSIESYGRFDLDLSVSPLLTSMSQDAWINEKDYFQELRLTSTPGELPVDWVIGAAYQRSTEDNRNRRLSNALNLDSAKNSGEFSRDTYTAYVDALWRFLPTWSLNLGGRYTKENYVINSEFYDMFFGPDQTQGRYSTDYDKFLPKLAISKELGDNHTIYSSYGKGLLSGGASWMAEETTMLGERLGYGKTYAPEMSEVIEVGYKSYWLDRRVMTNMSLFDARVKNYQYSYPDPATYATRIASIQEIRSRGVEGSISALLTDMWQAVLRFGFNDAKVTQVDGYSGASMSSGTRVPYAPKHNINIETTYSAPISDDWVFTPTLSVGHYGQVALDAKGEKFQDSYVIVKSNFEFKYRDDYSIRLWGDNLTDERYKTFSYSGLSTYGDPLRFGVDLEAKF
jgi:outer membrane receptor protein involved in Fe transport